jgi:hypothetical protein
MPRMTSFRPTPWSPERTHTRWSSKHIFESHDLAAPLPCPSPGELRHGRASYGLPASSTKAARVVSSAPASLARRPWATTAAAIRGRRDAGPQLRASLRRPLQDAGAPHPAAPPSRCRHGEPPDGAGMVLPASTMVAWPSMAACTRGGAGWPAQERLDPRGE